MIKKNYVNQVLLEGFFDNSKLNVKARNQEDRDPDEEEWERFQRRMSETYNNSAAVIAEDQEDVTNEKQIDKIEEPIKKLARYCYR